MERGRFPRGLLDLPSQCGGWCISCLSRSGLSSAALTSNPAATQFASLDDLFARYPFLTLVYCAGLLLHGSRSVAVQFNQFAPAISDAPLEWSHFCHLQCCDRNFGARMSLGMPAIVPQSGSATTLFATFFLFALCKAFWHIRRREVALHREWMIRAFSIGLAVATIRPIVGCSLLRALFRPDAPRIFRQWILIGFVCISSRQRLDSHHAAAAENGCRCRNNLGISLTAAVHA